MTTVNALTSKERKIYNQGRRQGRSDVENSITNALKTICEGALIMMTAVAWLIIVVLLQ